MAGEQLGEGGGAWGGSPGFPLEPFPGSSLPRCFAVGMVQVCPLEPILQMRTSRPSAGFAQQLLLGVGRGSRDGPQWVFPVVLPLDPDHALPTLQASPFSQKKKKQSKAKGRARALLASQARAELEVGRGACPPEPTGPPITQSRRPFEPGQEFKPPS